MPKTSRMLWEYPTESQKSWFNIFVALMNSMDGNVYASLENLNLILRGGGDVSLNTSTNVMTWTEDFEILSMMTGGVITIPAGSLSNFLAGKIAYVSVSRPVGGSAEATLSLADTLGTDDSKLFFGMRRGDVLYLRNHADRAAMSVFDKTGSEQITTGSIADSGGEETGSISIGVTKGSGWYFKATALSDTTDSTFKLYSDAGMTNEILSAENKDAYTSAYEDNSSWYLGSVTGGLIYYKVTNDGANASIYNIELSGFGQMEG